MSRGAVYDLKNGFWFNLMDQKQNMLSPADNLRDLLAGPEIKRPGSAIHFYCFLLLVLENFRVKFARALGADAVGEIGFRMGGDVIFDLLPVALFVPDLLA